MRSHILSLERNDHVASAGEGEQEDTSSAWLSSDLVRLVKRKKKTHLANFRQARSDCKVMVERKH